MIQYPIKLLLVEDNVDQVLLTERAFKRFNSEVRLVTVRDGKECVDALAREHFSALIVDYNLPGMDGTTVIRTVREKDLTIPIIMVTGQGDEEIAVTAMKAGATDYVSKTQGYFKKLPIVIEKAIETEELQTRLRESEEKYRRLAENANDLIFTIDHRGTFSFLTHKVNSLLGYAAEDLLHRDIREILTPESQQKANALFAVDLARLKANLVELEFVARSGVSKSFELSFTVLSRAGTVVGFEVIGRDITQRLLLEKQILQRNRELTTLLSVTSAVAHSLNIEEISSAALQRVCELEDWSCGAICTLKFSESAYHLSGSVNLPTHFLESFGNQVFLMDTLDSLMRFRRAMTDSDIEATADGSSFRRFAELCRREQIQSYILLPLFFKDRLFGFVFGGRHVRKDFGEEEIEILNSIAGQISVAVANARLFAAIREAKTEWETTFDAMSELICMQDLDGKIIRVNKALSRRLNLEPREVVNRSANEVFKDPQSPWCQHQKPEMYEKDKMIAVEFDDGTLKGYFEIATTPIYGANGELFAWLFVGKDITEQRYLQNQIVQVERLKALGEMASGVAHDFNNILAGILGKTQMLLKTLDRSAALDMDNVKHDLRVIEKTTIHGAQTVKRIQDFTRIRTDQKFNPVDVNQAIEEAVNMIRPLWKDQCELKGVRIDLQFTAANVPPISGIRSEIAQVVFNIIANAMDAMPTGGSVQITTESHREGSQELVGIRISDTGIGMSNEVKQKVFDPFFSTKGPKGTGLGMSVAYGIVSRHHGSITIDSELGEGTSCRLSFPAARAMEQTLNARVSGMANEKIRILIIDDEAVIREFLAEMFVVSGYDADVAASGVEGIALFDTRHYDLVFSDLGLPEMSGWDVAKSIRARNSQVPIVLLSGWGIQLDDVRIEDSGVDMVLSKPCQMEELLNAVDEALKRQRPAQA